MSQFGTTYEPREDMKPCPICGNMGYIQHVNFDDGTTFYNSSCLTDGCIMWNRNYEFKEEAVEAWNKRT